MLKRVLILGLTLIAVMPLVLFFWQPDGLKRAAMQIALERINQTGPYTVQVGEIHGNFFYTLYLRNVRIIAKDTTQELLRLESVAIQVAWLALWRKDANVTQLVIKQGDGVLKGSGHALLKPPYTTDFTFTTKNYPLHALTKGVTALPSSLTLVHSGDWRVHFSTGGWRFQTQGTLNDAPLTGEVSSQIDRYSGRITLKHLNLLKTGFSQLKKQQLSSNINFVGPITQPTHITAKGSVALQLTDQLTPWVTGQLNLREGQGSWIASARQEGIHARINATIDLPNSSALGTWTLEEKNFKGLATWLPSLRDASGEMQAQGRFAYRTQKGLLEGQGRGKMLRWQNTHLKETQFTFKASTEGLEELQITLKNLNTQAPPGPWDIKTGQINAHSLGPRWKTTVSLQFKNDTVVNAQGRIGRRAPEWNCLLDELALQLPGQQPWSLASQDTVISYQPQSLRIDHMDFARGKETVSFPRIALRGSAYEIRLRTSSLDPGFLTSFIPDLKTAGGSIQVNMDIYGQEKSVMANGRLTAQIPKVRLKAMSLDLHDIDVDIVCSSGVVEVKKMTAQTKKGSFQLVGKAQLPDLHFTLQSHEFMIETEKGIKLRSDVQLLLAGTVAAPKLTGDIVLSKGVYDVGQQKKRKKRRTKIRIRTLTPSRKKQRSRN